MSKPRYIILFLLLLPGFIIFGQKLKPVRLEVPAGVDVETFHVEILSTGQVLIFYESNDVNNEGLRKWYFGLFNKSLKQKWLKYIPLTDKLEFLEARSSGNLLYLLFRNSTRAKSAENFYDIVHYNMDSEEFAKVSGTFPQKAEIAGFEVIDKVGCLALNLKGLATDLVFINLFTGDVNPLHIEEATNNYILRLFADTQWKRFYVGLKSLKDNRYITDEIISLTKEGKADKVLTVENNDNLKVISDYVFVPENNQRLRVFGIYDIYTGRLPSLRDFEDDKQEQEEAHSVGMFFLEFDNGQQTVLKYFDFLKLDNIYGTLGNRKMDYVKSGAKNESTKEVTAYYNFYGPSVFKMNDQYIFSVETYKPFYKTETRMDYDYYGRPVPYSYTVFAGYNYYDVIVIGMSKDGKLIWNNDFPIRDVLTYTLSRQSTVFEDEGLISIAYVSNGKVFLKTIEGQVDIGTADTPIVTKIEHDRVTSSHFNHILHWYDNYYLIYGYQKLKNRSLNEQNIRTVFYINKIAYN